MTTELITMTDTPLEVRMNADKYPRLHTYEHGAAVHHMSAVVTQAFLLRGAALDTANVQFIATALVDELTADNDNVGTAQLTFAEISRTIKKAVLTQDMYGISVATLYKVLLAYCKGEGHTLQLEANKLISAQRREDLKNSVIAPMLQVYAGQIVKHQKNK